MAKNSTKAPLGSTKSFQVGRYLAHNDSFTIAESAPDRFGRTMTGMTWNPSPDRPRGFPNVRQHQQWFIVDEAVAKLLMEHESRLAKEIGPPPAAPAAV